MKKTLEAALVVAALALGAYVARGVLARRQLALHPRAANPALAPGPDVETPGARPGRPPRHDVEGLPMIKMSRPPKPPRHKTAVPPPVSPAP